jgi:hypothetical protein
VLIHCYDHPRRYVPLHRGAWFVGRRIRLACVYAYTLLCAGTLTATTLHQHSASPTVREETQPCRICLFDMDTVTSDVGRRAPRAQHVSKLPKECTSLAISIERERDGFLELVVRRHRYDGMPDDASHRSQAAYNWC